MKLLHELRGQLGEAGLSGSFLVRDLATGEEIGIDPDVRYPIASLAKIPLALAVLDSIEHGRIDGAQLIDVAPGLVTAPGPTGVTRFRHPARISVEDLLYLSTSVSDNATADALFELIPPAEVDAAIQAMGISGITIRQTMAETAATPEGHARLTHSLAISGRTPGGGHVVAQLDLSRASIASARTLADLLQALWCPSKIPATVAERVRELMALNVIRHRLAPDFTSDATTWSAKTGTLLNLRHEIGVVEHDDGGQFAVVALTESRVPAANQPAAEALMGRVARALHDQLR